MKVLIILSLMLTTGCASYPGTDGRTYYWPKPLPIHSPYNQATDPKATTTNYQVNGKSYQITSFR